MSAVQNEIALSYHRMRGLYFLTVIFAANIYYASELFGLPQYKLWLAVNNNCTVYCISMCEAKRCY